MKPSAKEMAERLEDAAIASWTFCGDDYKSEHVDAIRTKIIDEHAASRLAVITAIEASEALRERLKKLVEEWRVAELDETMNDFGQCADELEAIMNDK